MVHHVTLARGGLGVEAHARAARYQAFQDTLNAGEVLVTAQHRDDQCETLLLALKRGSGPTGLSAMAPSSAFAGSRLLRPLLNETRESLRQWALAHQLSWIEDESNQDDTYDRNFLRLRVIPVLRERWPHFSDRRPQRQPVRRAGTTAGRDVGGGAGVAGGRRWLAGYRAAGDDESAAPSGAAASLARRAAGADARPRGA